MVQVGHSSSGITLQTFQARYGNKLVKQASKGETPAHTVTREFTGTEMITSFSTDNNAVKVKFTKTTNISINKVI